MVDWSERRLTFRPNQERIEILPGINVDNYVREARLDTGHVLNTHGYFMGHIAGMYDDSKTIFHSDISSVELMDILGYGHIVDAAYDQGWFWNVNWRHRLRVLMECDENVSSVYFPQTRYVELKLNTNGPARMPVVGTMYPCYPGEAFYQQRCIYAHPL